MNERIKELRKTLGLNQTDFGARIGIKQGTVAGYEGGTRVPLDAVISSICREFNVNEEWLRYGTGEMFLRRSRSEEISAFLGDVMAAEPDDIRVRLVNVMAHLTADDWAFLAKRAREIKAQLDEEAEKQEKAGPD